MIHCAECNPSAIINSNRVQLEVLHTLFHRQHNLWCESGGPCDGGRAGRGLERTSCEDGVVERSRGVSCATCRIRAGGFEGETSIAVLGPVYTWGRMEGWPELSKFEPIGWLHFFKSGPMGLYMGSDGTSTCPTCRLRWHGFGAKPSSPKGAIGSRFLVAGTPILVRMGPLRWIKLNLNKAQPLMKIMLTLL